MLDQITQALTDAVLPSITLTSPLVGLVLVAVLRLVKSRTKSEMTAWALERITQTILTVVTNHMQTTIKDDAPDALEPEMVKVLALNQVYEQIPQDVIEKAKGGVNDIHRFINQKIEKTVFDLKQAIKNKVAP